MTKTKITEIVDRSAATAWSPVAEYANVIALGIKVRDHGYRPVHAYMYTSSCILVHACIMHNAYADD